MDSLLTAAAHALAAGDPLAALRRVALREDPPALALRGIALAQLGEFARARQLLKRAARGFGPREKVARARCAVAEAEIALAARDLAPSTTTLRTLGAAQRVLARHGDGANAAHARLVAIRHQLLLGRVQVAERLLAERDASPAPPSLVATFELAAADLALRRAHATLARSALERARPAAERAGNPLLVAEVEAALHALKSPAARLLASGEERALVLDDVELLLSSDQVVVDACRRAVRTRERVVQLAKRPVLFAIVRTLAEAWPLDATRELLLARAFGVRRSSDSHRTRLRVECGRLRGELRGILEVRATARGFVLHSSAGRTIVVLAPPVDEVDSTLLALLADGNAWSTSALALAYGASQRTVQRALSDLEAAGRVRSLGRARSRRWLAAPLVGFTTTLLLPSTLTSE